jgi:hypothetical protein
VKEIVPLGKGGKKTHKNHNAILLCLLHLTEETTPLKLRKFENLYSHPINVFIFGEILAISYLKNIISTYPKDFSWKKWHKFIKFFK